MIGVVAVTQAEGKMIFNPDADFKFEAADVAIVMGRAEDIEGFRKTFGLTS